MNKTKHLATKFSVFCAILLAAATVAAAPEGFGAVWQQQEKKSLPPPESAVDASHRTRLILKDGSYQVVISYKVVGDRVQYRSAERGGAQEEIPLELVDMEATKRWERQHAAPAEGGAAPAPEIDPELLKEEADRAAYTPEVAKDLQLPEEGSVFGLDTFQGTPEAVPMPQSDGTLNRNTAHNVLRAVVNPLSSSHQLVELKGERAAVQFHVPDPVLFIRIGDDAPPSRSGAPMTVDTHGASSAMKDAPPGGSADSRYVIVRADVRTGSRVVTSFKISALGTVHRDQDVIETTSEMLQGGHWMKLTPKEPLSFGEFALMEVISEKEVNLGVWDFGVHPTAPENRDVILPEPKRPLSLERRRPGSPD
jgi:hypothetical protein